MKCVLFLLILLSLSLGADDSADVLKHANALNKSAQYQEAIKLYSAVLDSNAGADGKAKALRGIAESHTQMGNEKDATAAYARLFNEYPAQCTEVLKAVKRFQDAEALLRLDCEKKENRSTRQPGSRVREKLESIVIPRIRFVDTPVRKIYEELEKLSRKLDPTGTGIEFRITDAPALTQDQGKADSSDIFADSSKMPESNAIARNEETDEPGVTLDFSNIPLADLVHYICKLTDSYMRFDPDAVTIMFGSDEIRVRSFPIDIRFFQKKDGAVPDNREFEELLRRMGVRFDRTESGVLPGVWYDPVTSKILVANTAENLRLIEQLLTHRRHIPQVLMEAAVIEVDLPDGIRLSSRTLSALPEFRKKRLVTLSICTQSGDEATAKQTSDLRKGEGGVRTARLLTTPQVAEDDFSISADIHFAVQAFASRKELAQYEQEAVTSPVWELELRTKIGLVDGSQIVMQLEEKTQEHGPRYLVIRARIMNEDGTPRRETEGSTREDKALQLLLRQ